MATTVQHHLLVVGQAAFQGFPAGGPHQAVSVSVHQQDLVANIGQTGSEIHLVQPQRLVANRFHGRRPGRGNQVIPKGRVPRLESLAIPLAQKKARNSASGASRAAARTAPGAPASAAIRSGAGARIPPAGSPGRKAPGTGTARPAPRSNRTNNPSNVPASPPDALAAPPGGPPNPDGGSKATGSTLPPGWPGGPTRCR